MLAQRPDPVACQVCDRHIPIITVGTVVKPKVKKWQPVISLGLAQNKGKYSILEAIKLTNPAQQVKDGSQVINYNYQNIETPIIIAYNPTNFLSVGGGLQASYLLNASQDTRKINFDTDQRFNRLGFGWLLDAEIGAKNRGPRLGFTYTQYYGSGLKAKSYGTLEATIRVQIGKKPQ